ncbi:hypothetical protein [uncultured Alteromonas sp.]|jgi:predicted nucleic-acid-binding Zn-ribbon protein|uniref:hypothetical protein n=1 Tax=uncultured Alteromonas sp. TaxID=179113 RepID=UPI0025CC9404|nr:hypothetical protein [uncultured Alteromonas sp.]
MGFINKLGKGLKGAIKAVRSDEYQINSVDINCIHCGHQHFDEGKAQLNTAFLTFINADWANQSASVLVCKNCSYIMWFGKTPGKKV